MSPAVRRSFLGALLDRFITWSGGLPPEATNYTIESLRIPLEGDVKLAADLYRPLVEPIGTILVRSPYGIGTAFATANARAWAARRYQVLFSSCRGTAESGGVFDGARCEEADGHAVVAWMRKQPWYTGTFATLGPSYLGYVQWTLLSNPPPDMVAAIINTGPHDFSNFAWETGAFNSDAILWADFQERAKRGNLVPPILYQYLQGRQLVPLFDSVPLQPALDKYFAKDRPEWLFGMMTLPDLKDPFWKCLQHSDAFAKAKIPIYLTTGWYDLLMPSVMTAYRGLVENGCNVALTMGPWTHFGAGGRYTMTETLNWLDAYVGKTAESDGRPSPVRVYITGKEEWRQLPKWPPPTTPYELFLGPDKTLSKTQPPADTPGSKFQFDPAKATPTSGVPQLFDAVKHNENTNLQSRSDVLTFTTAPLEQDLEVCGQPVIHLYHSSDNPHADVLVNVNEIDKKGKSFQISEKFMRLAVGRTPGIVELVLHDCGHVFRKGMRIQVLVAGGSHPRFLRNLGTDESYTTGTTFKPTWHTIHHSASEVSKLVLPVTAMPGK